MTTIPDCTLVSASFCFDHINRHVRSFEETCKGLEALMKMPCYLVLYGDKKTIQHMKSKRTEYGLDSITVYKEQEASELWSFQYLYKVKANRELYHPTKDERTTAETHLITCNKFDFVLQVINENPFETTKFGWIDSNLGPNASKICEDFDIFKMNHLLSNISEKFHIQIINVCDKKYKEIDAKREYYQQYRWVVCGCLFTCGKEIGTKILNRLKEIVTTTTMLGYGHGEEMTYLEVLDEFYDDIHRSYGDYGQIVNNFLRPTKNISYIYHLILMNYFNKGYYRECYDCARVLLEEIESYTLFVGWEMYMKTLYVCYASCYYYNQKESQNIVKHIKDVCSKNPLMNIEYLKNRDFYDKMFEFASTGVKQIYDVIFCIFACATQEKYKNEILKINQTWGKKAKEYDSLKGYDGIKLLFFLGEEQTDLVGEEYVYLKGVKNDYESASYKQFLGLKYISEKFNTKFVYCCGTDTYVNIPKLMDYLSGGFDSRDTLYIGGHGATSEVNGNIYYFHSGGPGFILSNACFQKIYPLLVNNKIIDMWNEVCLNSNKLSLLGACDVCISYFLHQKEVYKDYVNIIKNSGFYNCNFRGLCYNNTYNCCDSHIQIQNIIACHNMTLEDFDYFTNILENNNYFVEN